MNITPVDSHNHDPFSVENEYLSLLRTIMNDGEDYADRTGVGRKSLICPNPIHYHMQEGFPLFTTKKVFFKGIVGELLWFLEGSTNNNVLVNKYGTSIWNEWAKEDGELGPIYGYQWRNFNGQGVDQIKNVIEEIKRNPGSSRLIVSAWNPVQIEDMALPPCHCFFQFFVRDASHHERLHAITTNSLGRMSEDDISRLEQQFSRLDFNARESLLEGLHAPKRRLDCLMYQRSADMFLGVPFNVPSYSLLLHMVAAVTGLAPGSFKHILGDAHIYANQYQQVATQCERNTLTLPKLRLRPVESIDDYTTEDIRIVEYVSWPAIKAQVAV